MANPEHIQFLKRGVKEWNAWRESQNPKIDLSEAELSNAKLGDPDVRLDLSDADLRAAKFNGADLTTAEFAGANLEWADLSGATLNDANFLATNLARANLSGSNLSEAVLTDANLFFAKLSRADLSEADVGMANFWFADLTDADLRAANIGYANFACAKLVRANLQGVLVAGTVFADTDLTGAKGLETCAHFEPSVIDFWTLEKSGWLPEVFLRGCGLPEESIRHLFSLLNQPIQFYSCFISYSHEDKAFACLLHDRLQGQGIRCWLDEHQLLPGDDLHDRIDQGIRLWDKVLLCASKSSLTSWWVDGEINRAFQKEAQIMKERGKKVLALIPLNLDGFLFSADYQSGKKAEIKSRVAANFVGWEKDHALFDRELEKVIRALRTGDAGREKPPQSKL